MRQKAKNEKEQCNGQDKVFVLNTNYSILENNKQPLKINLQPWKMTKS
jgi:hypothetical protein